MTRLLFVALASFSSAAAAPAQDKKEATPKQEPTLRVGDAAPPLKASKWLRGPKVKAFEPGRVYVVEFWATWCGPCVAAMPHLARLQAEYKDRGVTVVGFTARDILGRPDHAERDVTAFLDGRGKRFDYTFAYADDGDTAKDYLAAAGRAGIPCSFVVDKAGRIAYVGHPMYLPAALPRAVEGKATAREIGADMARIEAEFRELSGDLFRHPKASLRALQAFEAKYPPLADFLVAAKIKLSLLPKHGAAGEAKDYAEGLVAKATKEKDGPTLGLVSALLRNGDGKDDRDLLAVAVAAAEAEVALDGGTDPWSLLALADAHFVGGDKAKAREYARKAKAAAGGESAAVRAAVAKEAARRGAD